MTSHFRKVTLFLSLYSRMEIISIQWIYFISTYFLLNLVTETVPETVN